jgi:hypothetical protein
MTVHVLVESNQAAIMLAKLLNAEQQAGQIEIRAARPSSSLYSAARTLLALRGEPVALLLDADSTDPQSATRRRLTAEEVVGDVAGSASLRILVVVPALEALLFRRPDPVAKAFGAAAKNEQLLELGRLNPREALKRLDPAGHWWTASLNLVRSLTDEDVTALRSAPPIDELLQFLKDLQCSQMSASSGV